MKTHNSYPGTVTPGKVLALGVAASAIIMGGQEAVADVSLDRHYPLETKYVDSYAYYPRYKIGIVAAHMLVNGPRPPITNAEKDMEGFLKVNPSYLRQTYPDIPPQVILGAYTCRATEITAGRVPEEHNFKFLCSSDPLIGA